MENISQVVGVGYDGEGVCRVDGKVVFVKGVLKGEKIKFSIYQSNSKFSRGRLIEVLEKSDYRVSPPCKYYGRCGGCSYQHTTYQNEVETKKYLLSSQLAKVGYSGQVEAISSPQCYQYRNKIKLFVGEGGLSLKGEGICAIDKCLLVSDSVNNIIGKINKFLKAFEGVFSEVLIREEGVSHLIVFKKIKPVEVNYQGIFLVLGKNIGIFEDFNGILSHKIGIKEIVKEELGLKVALGARTFHQVNKFVYEGLYLKAIDKIVGDKVVNAYSGAGLLSGIISLNREVVGVELGRSEHLDAESLKRENGLVNLTNINGDCEAVLPGLSCDTLIVDPPRGGMSRGVCESVNKMGITRLIYISCDSATLVRDISRLQNFAVKEVFLFDMFPRTGEYEVLTILDKISK